MDSAHAEIDPRRRSKELDGQGGARGPSDRRCPDMPWEPKAAFTALADYYRG